MVAKGVVLVDEIVDEVVVVVEDVVVVVEELVCCRKNKGQSCDFNDQKVTNQHSVN